MEEEPSVNKLQKILVLRQFVYIFNLDILVFKDVIEDCLLITFLLVYDL